MHHHRSDRLGVSNVCERVGFENHQVGPPPGSNGAELIHAVEVSGRFVGGNSEGLVCADSCVDEQLHLVMHDLGFVVCADEERRTRVVQSAYQPLAIGFAHPP